MSPREGFRRKVGEVEEQVAQMASLAEGMLFDGVAALERLDRDAAEDVIRRGKALARADEDLEHEILQLLILQAPMASDLRRMGSALKAITYLNRLGRYGYDIAHMVRDWPEAQGHVHEMMGIPEMAAKVRSMLELVLQAYRDRRPPDARSLMALEDEVDRSRFKVWEDCLASMTRDADANEACANYMLAAQYLERCGDNICKMAEKAHYAVTGERLLLH